MEEDGWYYDNAEEIPDTPAADDAERRLVVERVYGLAWRRFAPADRETLRQIHEGLPGWQPPSGDGARWSSPTEDRDPHPWASVEPPGLQVAGVLARGLWREGDARFRREVIRRNLPRYICV
ncbi:hypothetical protein AB0467_07750 [Streptomyces sp. NPDC052095]|uniref:hypothetical protein n=1 Tax=unclassified Streptomyces TaxID=2593676 RepID=UPI00344C3310